MNSKRSNFLKVTLLLISISIIFTVTSKIVSANNKNVYDTNAKLYDKSNNEVINYAYSFLGKPYIYGASGPNAFDCSGFTKFIYKYFSKDLPRTCKEQYNIC